MHCQSLLFIIAGFGNTEIYKISQFTATKAVFFLLFSVMFSLYFILVFILFILLKSKYYIIYTENNYCGIIIY